MLRGDAFGANFNIIMLYSQLKLIFLNKDLVEMKFSLMIKTERKKDIADFPENRHWFKTFIRFSSDAANNVIYFLKTSTFVSGIMKVFY